MFENFRGNRPVQIALEGVLYAVLMRLGAAYVVGHLFAALGGDHDLLQRLRVGRGLRPGAGARGRVRFRRCG